MIIGRTSIIIPGRCEPYFQETVDSVLASATGDIEVIAVVDGPGQKPEVLSSDSRVKIINLEKSIGQRAAYNLGVRESSGEYVMKIDAHALLSHGFDEDLKKTCPEKTVVLPEMRRLNVHTWESKPSGKTHFMFFGLDLYCHFWPAYKTRPEAEGDCPEVLTGQGSCWFTRRDWNDHIGLLDEGVGSWGNVGIEISLRTWLCGGSQIVNKNVWQAHWFRKDEGGFTYPMNGRQVARAHKYTYENYYFKDDAFTNQTRPFKWLIEKFQPPGWEAYLVDGFHAPRHIVYYTDSKIDLQLANAVRKRIKKTCGPIPIVSVSQEPLNFGKNICIGEQPRKYKSIHEAILAGVEATPEGSIIYLCEHDVFYHPSHFAKLPDDENTMYFDTNRYYYSKGNSSFVKARGKRALSQCVGHRDTIIRHIKERLDHGLDEAGEEIVERWSDLEKRSSVKYANYTSDRPSVDILHDGNFTPRGDYKKGYLEGNRKGIVNLPGWGGPAHFENKTGYKKELDSGEYIKAKFKKWMPQVSPIRIPKLKRSQLPNYFKVMKFKVGAEVGVMDGRNSENICKRIPNVKLYCIDMWDTIERKYGKFSTDRAANNFEQAKKRMNGFNAHFIKGSSMEVVKQFEDESLDFVYIDANHEYDFVMQDIIEWSKKVKIGGIVSGHDYYRTRGMGVVPAVDSYTFAHGINEWYITDEKEASFFWVKT